VHPVSLEATKLERYLERRSTPLAKFDICELRTLER
jgi:hypothetical protein